MSWFKVHMFCPDGAFTAEEVKEYIEAGIHSKGLMMRMLPIEVIEIDSNDYDKFLNKE